jgi:hypothetical protein
MKDHGEKKKSTEANAEQYGEAPPKPLGQISNWPCKVGELSKDSPRQTPQHSHKKVC